MQDKWIFYKEVDFTDQSILQYHIDTRDFCCNTNTEKSNEIRDIDTLLKNADKFLYTAQEVTDLLDRYFTDSGGRVKIRIFTLDDPELHNWNLKYLRIFRVGQLFLICNRYNWALNKTKTSSLVLKPDYQN